jgi:hypothetical protein
MGLFEQWMSVGFGNSPTLGLLVLIIVLGLANWRHGRKIRRLEAQLVHTHQALRQEVKMMGQGAIGVGHRVKHLEKQIRRQPSPFEQLLMQQPAPEAAQPDPRIAAPESSKPGSEPDTAKTKRTQSRAERALAQWMSETRHTA